MPGRAFLLPAFFALSYILPAQSGQQLLEQQEYDAARAAFEREIRQQKEPTAALLGMASLFAEEDYAHYNPDTAYIFLRKGQQSLRRLSPGRRKKLERQGFGNASLRQLKNEIREKGLLFALARDTSEALIHYMEHYRRLDHDSEKRAMAAFLQARFDELRQEGQYKSLRDFARLKEADIREYLPELQDSLQDAIFSAYFRNRDSTELSALFALLADYPEAAARLDGPLSRALRKMPVIARAEAALRGKDHRRMPRTVAVIYRYHYLTGEWSNLLGFQNRYPFYADSFNIQAAITIARAAPDLQLGFTDDRQEAYQRYIELAAPVHKAYVALQQLIAPDLRGKKWEKAAATVRRFAPHFGEEDPRIAELLSVLARPEEGLRPYSLGEPVNSELGEYAPVISADGRLLLFCRFIEGSEDIYASGREGESWGRPYPIEALNTREHHEAPIALSADGTTMLIYDGGIVKSTDKQPGGWSAPRNFFPEAYTPDWQGGTTFASNREAVIFAARSEDVIGARAEDNIDLFVSLRQPGGEWGPPASLGAVLNTPFEDRSPFLHPDMRTLYFSSRGHGGLGSLDVFVTTRIGDGWTKWTAPVNLGKEINLPGRDWGYKVSTDGATAYFSADVPGRREELFQVGVPEGLRPQPVATIRGLLLGLDGAPLPAALLLEDLTTGETVGQARPDPATGEFFITLPSGRLYSYTVQGPGIYPVSNNIDLRGSATPLEVEEKIQAPTLEEIEEGNITLPLKNLFFETDKYDIRPESFPELNRLAELMKAYNLQVEIAGHTDNIGGEEYNLSLSRNRAEAVRGYLLNRGAGASQVTAAGYGLTQPLAGNESPEGRAMNRRVEIRFRGRQ